MSVLAGPQGSASKCSASGKTPPRLIEDLREYDPLAKGRNILCQPPLHVDVKDTPKRPAASHKHILIRRDRTVLPRHDSKDSSRPWTSVSICESCRMHVEIVADSSEPTLSETTPCPSKENFLHHLRYEPSKSRPVSSGNFGPEDRWEDVRVFSCTSTTCPMIVTITVRAPILSQRFVKLLMDQPMITKRAEAYYQKEGTFDPKTIYSATPYKVLKTLHSYLKNSILEDPRRIPRENMRYQTLLSDDCSEIMKRAHFKLGEDISAWIPPTPLDLQDRDGAVYRDQADMLEEVGILADNTRSADQELVRRGSVRAEGDIRRILRSEFDSVPTGPITLTIPEHPYYAALGIVADVSDKIVSWAYHHQRGCDPDCAPFYFECLSVLAAGRNSEALQVEVATLQSQGEFATRDLNEACNAIGISPDEKDEDLIIGIFRSRLVDAPRQEQPMRAALRMIGKKLKSSKIMAVAQKAFSDVKGAYSWLGTPETTDDQFILSTYNVRVSDYPDEEGTAKEALKAIAEARRSPLLLSFLESGSVYEMPEDLNIAYTTLDPTLVEGNQTISDDMLIDVFNCRLVDAPSRIQDLRAALRVIGEKRDSVKIKSFLQTGQNDAQASGSVTSPVGLENIGNTCYLNSLLQFYFTIKPLRDMILDFDKYTEGAISDEIINRKRVGGRKVTEKEIERAKKFVTHLRTLFQRMIKSKSSAVTPERDLAYLALVSSKDESEAAVHKPKSDDAAPQITVESIDDRMDIDQAPAVAQEDDAASETTLVNEPQDIIVPDEDLTMSDQDQKDSDGKENVPPIKDVAAVSTSPPKVPLKDIIVNLGNHDAPLTPPPEPDRKPPPIPLRPTARRNTATDINMFGRQQDVTECIGNVMFQLEAAIKPISIDENEEQVDLIKALFYGRTKQTLAFPNSVEVRTKEELFSHLLVNVSEGDRDLYAALDNSFDIEQVDLEGREARRYLSISTLPPVLQIQVQRVQFDREKGSAYKSNAHLNFPETLFMDRYMDTDDPGLKARREESWKWKEQLGELSKQKASFRTSVDVDMLSVLDITREWIEDEQTSGTDGDAIDPILVTILDQRTAAVRRKLEDVDKQIKDLESRINQQFTDLREYGYRIHSVFIHRGSVSFGHYWIYIYDFQKRLFRKYNDQYVSEVADLSEVFTHSDTDTQPPTPYFLVFVRDSQLDITEAVRREIEG